MVPADLAADQGELPVVLAKVGHLGDNDPRMEVPITDGQEVLEHRAADQAGLEALVALVVVPVGWAQADHPEEVVLNSIH